MVEPFMHFSKEELSFNRRGHLEANETTQVFGCFMGLKRKATDTTEPGLSNKIYQRNNDRFGDVKKGTKDILEYLNSGPDSLKFVLRVM